MEISPLAGKPAPKNMLVDPALLERDYYERWPDLSDLDQLVNFGTSGHRGVIAAMKRLAPPRARQRTDRGGK